MARRAHPRDPRPLRDEGRGGGRRIRRREVWPSGQTVRFRLEAHPDLEFTGKIASILSTVQRQSLAEPRSRWSSSWSTSTRPTRARCAPACDSAASIETGRIAGTLLVPADAVFPTESGPVAFRKSVVGYSRRPLVLGRPERGVGRGEVGARRRRSRRAPRSRRGRAESAVKRRGVVVLGAGAGRRSRRRRRGSAGSARGPDVPTLVVADRAVRASRGGRREPRGRRGDAGDGADRCPGSDEGGVARPGREPRQAGGRDRPFRSHRRWSAA